MLVRRLYRLACTVVGVAVVVLWQSATVARAARLFRDARGVRTNQVVEGRADVHNTGA
eukprot:jgi/Botrbrau1/5893/Bobra.0366s0071.1